MGKIQIEDIIIANQTLKDVVVHTPLQKNQVLSERYECNVYLKREDMQVVRSFKIRGAFHQISSIPKEELNNGVVCASAGNHAQGVAYSCHTLQIPGKIFMPTTTPRQKVDQVKFFGKEYVEVILTGDTFDDSFNEAKEYGIKHKMTFIHPFDQEKIVAGQGTVGMEIMNDIDDNIDYLFCSIGGGGLISGVGTYIKSISPRTKVIGCEPAGAPAMKESLKQGKVIELEKIDKFVDGAAVKKVGEIPFEICQKILEDIVLVPEGKICTTILNLYNQDAIVAEPAGAMPIAALDFFKDEIKGKTVVCVLSGGNNDIGRMQEMRERSLIYEGLQHYFIIQFPQRAGALKEFILDVLGPDDDITRFEYTKKNNKSNGPVLIGIELKCDEDYHRLMDRLNKKGFEYREINKNESLFNLLI
ncbi:threonine ammonia-lyase IlvA [Halalkalibacterium halodurans]|uniref:L-threonine dehydratase biosynthetic IlvA n=1 Tax=Halalkalibacterium halodurans (strain ATCC BAA-125 / DSM 18197 / FERM 7344 / JCM 9153 / C-125) TaxID=272558 RepID=ILVA_HALH5|nr:threonine ammonia-lyase IlvA [Halalkalibacterium halodurans]Q9KC63.1 RecName: Full=L-threonine dehydratase biosynthetic IlvA; AltName: Full=Threonine deaminase [Halalkalibacterium halodurans C-125]MDY7222280.1 threonine ammonia-lyase IlvA [Halalkalibacterium halodurans]MDY7241501.1 threonine ammonia-lyase IlvA [Halalkalibacterium halodurans]MED4082415.1 threonine ammonia-lyase IlvA [Halalkalibacterium halodurans]MED4083434.1 threonine ammonia-lyase IlvA [Halalkalibacterium halodurans]MED41